MDMGVSIYIPTCKAGLFQKGEALLFFAKIILRRRHYEA